MAATVSYDISNMTATLTPRLPLANSTTYTATITTGVTSTGNERTLAAELHMVIHNCDCAPAPSVTAVTPANLSTTAAINDDRDGDVQSGDEFVDDHCLDLHADRARKHVYTGNRRATTPDLRLRRSLRRRIWLTTPHTQRRLARALRVQLELRWPRLTHGASRRRRHRFRPLQQPFRRAALRA